MYLNEVVPLLNLPRSHPQILSYFSAEKQNQRILANIQVGRIKTLGLIINSQLIADKISIKKAGFNFKPLGTLYNPKPIVTEQQWELIKWLAEYYFLPLSGLLKIALPNKTILKKTREVISNNKKMRKAEKNVFIFGDNFKFFKKLILEKIKMEEQVLFVFPNQIKLELYLKKLRQFYNDIAVFDKQAKQKELLLTLEQINQNKKKIIFGKRASIFAPFANLGAIVVIDEENSALETWEPEIHFNAKNACLKLKELFNSSIIFSSFTPSVESWHLINKGFFKKISKLHSPSDLTIIDLKKTPFNTILSQKTTEEIKNILQQKKSVVIFTNRRGASPALICQDCGYIFECPHCSVPMTHYQFFGYNEMRCRHCGYKTQPIDFCPQCQSHLINSVGVGNQKVLEFCEKNFSEYKSAIFDSDNLKGLKEEKLLFEKFKNKEIDILIITELFVKFLDISKIDLGVITSAEQITVFPDFRSEERLKNIIFKLNQSCVKVIVQTLKPEKEIFENIKNLDKYYNNELKLRNDLFYPPFSEIVKITLKSKNKGLLERQANYYHQLIKQRLNRLLGPKNAQILPIMPAFVPKIKGFYLKEIFLKVRPGHTLERNKIINFLPDHTSIKINPNSLI